MKTLEKLYTVSFSKVFNERKAEIESVTVHGEIMDVIFCEGEKGLFVIAGKFRKSGPRRVMGRYCGGRAYYDVFFRKNFKTREEGNEFFKRVKANKTI